MGYEIGLRDRRPARVELLEDRVAVAGEEPRATLIPQEPGQPDVVVVTEGDLVELGSRLAEPQHRRRTGCSK